MTSIALTSAPAGVHRMGMLERRNPRIGLRVPRPLVTSSRRRAAFWAIGVDRLTVAVIEPGDDEPLLVACATVRGQAQTPVCPGLTEAALIARARDLPHVAALGAPHCRVEPSVPQRVRGGAVVGVGAPAAASPPAHDADAERVTVDGPGGTLIHADASALRWVDRVFRTAGMHLLRVECAELALRSLAWSLGDGDALHDAAAAARTLSSGDPLTAVSVCEGCEDDAAALGSLLGVPVGLALTFFDAHRSTPDDTDVAAWAGAVEPSGEASD